VSRLQNAARFLTQSSGGSHLEISFEKHYRSWNLISRCSPSPRPNDSLAPARSAFAGLRLRPDSFRRLPRACHELCSPDIEEGIHFNAETQRFRRGTRRVTKFSAKLSRLCGLCVKTWFQNWKKFMTDSNGESPLGEGEALLLLWILRSYRFNSMKGFRIISFHEPEISEDWRRDAARTRRRGRPRYTRRFMGGGQFKKELRTIDREQEADPISNVTFSRRSNCYLCVRRGEFVDAVGGDDL